MMGYYSCPGKTDHEPWPIWTEE